MYKRILETAEWLKAKMTTKPETAIILGTGLGELAKEIEKEITIPYAEIPNFPDVCNKSFVGSNIKPILRIYKNLFFINVYQPQRGECFVFYSRRNSNFL